MIIANKNGKVSDYCLPPSLSFARSCLVVAAGLSRGGWAIHKAPNLQLLLPPSVISHHRYR